MTKYKGVPISITREIVVIRPESGFDHRFEYLHRSEILDVLIEARMRGISCEVEIDYGCIIVSARLET